MPGIPPGGMLMPVVCNFKFEEQFSSFSYLALILYNHNNLRTLCRYKNVIKSRGKLFHTTSKSLLLLVVVLLLFDCFE